MKTKSKWVSTTLLAIVAAAVILAPGAKLYADEDADLDKMIAAAKTPADHEAIATQYEKMAADAKAEAAKHVEMGEVYKKAGGALIGKQHLDSHCETLATLYKKIAKENETLAKAHKAMAKEAK